MVISLEKYADGCEISRSFTKCQHSWQETRLLICTLDIRTTKNMALSDNIPIRYAHPPSVLHNDSDTDTELHQQTYEGLYDSYHPTHVTEELLSGQAPNGMLAAAHLTPTPDSFFPLPQLQLQPYYGFDVNGNVCCWQFPTAIPSCCQSHAPTLLAPVNSNFVDQPPTLPPFGYGPIAGGGVPPRAFDIRQQVPTRESSVQSSAFTNNIWSPVQLQPSPAPSFTESTGRSTTCSPIEHNEDLAYWSGPQYFAYPRFAQAEADAWDVQAYPDPIAASIQQYTVSQTFPWSLPQPAAPAPALAPSSLSSDQFSVAVPTEPHDSATHDPTTTTSPSTIHVTTPPSIPASSTSSFDSNPAPRPARRPRAVPASFKIRKNNIINPKAKIPEAWELEVVALKEKHTYSQIQRIIAAKYGVQKAISTIRGVKRNVVLPPHLRPRKAEWGPEHVSVLMLVLPCQAFLEMPSFSTTSTASSLRSL